MLNKKSKKTEDKENDNIGNRHSFAPFSNIRKSFRRLKQRRIKRTRSVESIHEKNEKNSKSDKRNCTKVISPDKAHHPDNQNILRRIASGKRFRRKNVQSMITVEEIKKFNVVEWSSCESLSDNFEKKVQKHNSLRRSKASLLMPVSGNKDVKHASPPRTKITRYSSMNAINEENKIKVDNKWYCSQQNISEPPIKNNNNNKLKSLSSVNIEKRKRPKTRKCNSSSLPNILEDLVEKKMDVVEGGERKVSGDINSDKMKDQKTLEIFLGNKRSSKRLSLLILDDKNASMLFSSSLYLDRPEIPSAPKPINRRDKALRRSVSTEALTPRKRRADSVNNNKLSKRTMSDCNITFLPESSVPDRPIDFHKSILSINSNSDTFIENKTQTQNSEKQAKSEKENNSCVSLPTSPRKLSQCVSVNDLPSIVIQNENLWKRSMASSELPLAIAEAVWDHTTLNNDELAFSSGDVIAVLFTEDESWWWGARGEEEGWFPASYVRLRVVQEIDDDLETTVHNHLKEPLTGNHSEKVELKPISVARKASVLSMIGLQERARNVEQIMTVRAKCVEELLNTEKDYVEMLRNIIEGYLVKVREEKNLFTSSDAEIIFGNIEELYKFHKSFLEDLKRNIKMDTMEESVVGHVFLKHKNNFEIYSHYCNNQPRSSARVSTLTKEKKYELFFETCRLRQNMIRLSVDGFLLSPVQRICKYPLQLKELLKHTCSDHADYKTLQEARSCMQNVASLINERKRRVENVNKLARWQLTVTNWKGENLVMKSSDLLLKGSLTKITDGRTSERMCYLFDHQLIYFCKDNSNKRQPLTYRGRIDLDKAMVENLDDNKVFVRGDTIPNTWRVWNKDKNKWCYFSADSREKKETWIDALENERDHVKEEQSKGFIVSQDVRSAAIESAYTKHIVGIKRGRMRRKSICTNHPELETTFGAPLVPPLQRQNTVVNGMNTGNVAVTEDGPTVTKRTNKPRRNRSFRWSLNSTIFEKYF